tara:strand:- start:88 stop:762 length:675 start_codon:yes stop_codon:yes gene_type:complete
MNYNFTYPTSILLGKQPCGKKVYPNAPNENCGSGCEVTGTRFKDADNELVLTRETLKKGNNRIYIKRNGQIVTPLINPNTEKVRGCITPFRALMNAGDIRSAHNKYIANSELADELQSKFDSDQIYYKAINQVSSTRRASTQAAVKMSGYLPRSSANSLEDLETFAPEGGNKIANWTGNSRYVYDGSDYIRFKKLQSNNRNFNDLTYGGDRNNASQVAKARVRH